MKRVLGKLVAVFAIVGAVSLVGANAAYAAHAQGGGAVVGSGTINPPLTLTPQAVSVSFGGTVTGAMRVDDSAVVGTMSCSFTGGGAADWVPLGSGSVSGSCAGSNVTGSMSASCPNNALSYARVGATVVVSGSCTLTVSSAVTGTTDSATVTVLSTLVFVPTSVPTNSYVLGGSVAAVG